MKNFNEVDFNKAKEFFRERSHLETWKPLNTIVGITINIYHVLSVILAIGTSMLFIDLVEKPYSYFLAAFTILLLAGLEKMKVLSSNNYWKENVKGGQSSFIVLMVICSIVSIGTSMFGGYNLNKILHEQKENEVSKGVTNEVDSIGLFYTNQILTTQAGIEDLQTSLKTTKNKWAKITVQNQISDQQDKLLSLIETRDKTTTKKTIEASTEKEGRGIEFIEKAYTFGLAILILELLMILGYKFKAWYLLGLIIQSKSSDEGKEESETSKKSPDFSVKNESKNGTNGIKPKYNSDSSYLKKYPEICERLIKGQHPNQIDKEGMFNVSRQTIFTIKNDLFPKNGKGKEDLHTIRVEL